MPNPLTSSELKLGRTMRRQGATWTHIAKTLGHKTDFVRKSLDVEFREYRSVLSANWVKKQRGGMQSRSSGTVGLGEAVIKPHDGKASEDRVRSIPAATLADRDRRAQLAPRSITAALMGDPPPGMSALDRKRGC